MCVFGGGAVLCLCSEDRTDLGSKYCSTTLTTILYNYVAVNVSLRIVTPNKAKMSITQLDGETHY